ncbi:MAG: HAD hydrolase-like protein [Hyphomonas sp.]
MDTENAKPLTGWTIVFDLDGTLVHTAPDLLRALNHVLGSIDLAPVELSTIENMVGHGAKAMLKRGMEHQGADPDAYDIDALFDAFLDYYSANICVDSHPFEGVVGVLDILAQQGATLAVCTNKRVALAVQLLDTLNLSGKFQAILGADSVPNRKPNGDHILRTIEIAAGKPDRAVMVGDSRTDERAARDVGLPFIFVPFGYESESIEQIGADAVVTHYSEFLSELSELTS